MNKPNIMTLSRVKDIYSVIPKGFKRKLIYQMIYNQMIDDGIKLDGDPGEPSVDRYIEQNNLDYKEYTLKILDKAICNEDIIKQSVKDLGIRKRTIIKMILNKCNNNQIEKQESKQLDNIKDDNIFNKCNIKGNELYIDYNLDTIDLILFIKDREDIIELSLDSFIFISDRETPYYDEIKDIYYTFDVGTKIDKELSIDIKDFADFVYYSKYYIEFILDMIKKLYRINIDNIFINRPQYMVNNKESILEQNIYLINFSNNPIRNYFIDKYGDTFKKIKLYYDFYEIYKVANGNIFVDRIDENSIEELYRKSDKNLLIDFINEESENIKNSLK